MGEAEVSLSPAGSAKDFQSASTQPDRRAPFRIVYHFDFSKLARWAQAEA